MTTIVHGASDDLIVIDGDIREEFALPGEGQTYLGFSDGTVLHIRYQDNGRWSITRVVKGRAEYRVAPSEDSMAGKRQDGTPGHGDVARLQGKISWAIAGEQIARPCKQEAVGGRG